MSWTARAWVLIAILTVLVASMVSALLASRLVARFGADAAVGGAPDLHGFIHTWAIVFAIAGPMIFAALFRLVRRGVIVGVGPDGVRSGGLLVDRMVPWDRIGRSWSVERRIGSSTFDSIRYFDLAGRPARISQRLQRNADELIDAIERRMR
jgi:hypothetical protein